MTTVPVTAVLLGVLGTMALLAGRLLSVTGSRRALRAARSAVPPPGRGAGADELDAYSATVHQMKTPDPAARYEIPALALALVGAAGIAIAGAALLDVSWARGVIGALPDLGAFDPLLPALTADRSAVIIPFGFRVAAFSTLVVLAVVATVAVLRRARGQALTWPRWPWRRVEHPPYPQFAFVVPAGEAPPAPWHKISPSGGTRYVQTRHLRRVGPEGLNPPGGAQGLTLCGRDLGGGSATVAEVDEGELGFGIGDAPGIEACYRCDQRRSQLVEAFEYEVGILPLSPRDQRRWDAMRRTYTPWIDISQERR